jgi:hypothetical protein
MSVWKWMTSNSLARAPHQGQLVQMRGQVRLQRRGVQPDGLVAHRGQSGGGLRLGAGEQRHVMAQGHQRVGQVRHHPLGAAVQLGRHGFVQRGDLGDTHSQNSLARRPRPRRGA